METAPKTGEAIAVFVPAKPAMSVKGQPYGHYYVVRWEEWTTREYVPASAGLYERVERKHGGWKEATLNTTFDEGVPTRWLALERAMRWARVSDDGSYALDA